MVEVFGWVHKDPRLRNGEVAEVRCRGVGKGPLSSSSTRFFVPAL